MNRFTASATAGQRCMLLLVTGSGLALAALVMRESSTARSVETNPMPVVVDSAHTIAPTLRAAATVEQDGTRSAPADREPSPHPQLATPTATATQLLVRVDAEPQRARRVSLVMTETSRAAPTVIATQRTAEDGVARFAPCSTTTTNVGLDFDMPTCGAYAQAIDATTRAATLVLPDLGVLRVRLVDSDGTQSTAPATAEVRVLDAIPPATRLHTQFLADGQGCFMVEAAALDLEVRITAADGRVSQPIRVRGPATAGGDGECSVKLPAPRILRARILDQRGQALPQARVAVHVEGSGTRVANAVADDSGVIAFRAPNSPGRGRAIGLVFLAQDATDKHWQGQAHFDLQPDANTALGDVFLREPPTLVAGVCVDPNGLPRRDIVLRLQVEQPMAIDKSGQRADAWIDLPCGSVISQPDGSFRALGNALPGQRLRLLALGQNVPPRLFQAGVENVKLVLPGRVGWPAARP